MTIQPPLVYLVDDDPAVLRGLSRLLRAWGYRARAFECAQDYLDFSPADREVPDCLLLDVHMPGLSGIELQAQLKAAGQSTPIVFLTGHLDATLLGRAQSYGAVEFLEKPIGEADLMRAVSEAVRRARTQDDD